MTSLKTGSYMQLLLTRLWTRTAGAAGRQQRSAGAAVACSCWKCPASGASGSQPTVRCHVYSRNARRGMPSILGSWTVPSAPQALLWWLPAAWALRFFGHDSSAASGKPGDSGSAVGTSMRWSKYTVLLQWDPRSVVTANELAEWATQYGEASSASSTV